MFCKPVFTEAKITAIRRAKRGYAPPRKKNTGQHKTWKALIASGIVEQRSNGKYYLTDYGRTVYHGFEAKRVEESRCGYSLHSAGPGSGQRECDPSNVEESYRGPRLEESSAIESTQEAS